VLDQLLLVRHTESGGYALAAAVVFDETANFKKMTRLKIVIRRPGKGQERPIVLGRFSSTMISVLLTLVVIAMVTTAIVLGYLVLCVVLAALLIAIVISLLLGVFQNIRR